VLFSLHFGWGTCVKTCSDYGTHKIFSNEFYVSATTLIVIVPASRRELTANTDK
jgi:hypothetical protein